MKILMLNEEEKVAVTTVINEILRSDVFGDILKFRSLVKISDKRDEVYLIESSDGQYISSFMRGDVGKNYKILTYKIKLGFIIRREFMIGIESLRFIANHCQNPIILSSRQQERFIYGKDLYLKLDKINKDLKKYSDNSLVLVCNKKRIPIGYAKILHEEEKVQLKNIVDVGIYLRSEKTAF